MKARTFKEIDGDVYKVSIYTEDWSVRDIDLMIKFAEPEMDVGGSFTGDATFTLPERLVRIKAESPFTVGFDSRDYDDARERADTWAATVLVRLGAAITTLRAQDDDFTTEAVIII